MIDIIDPDERRRLETLKRQFNDKLNIYSSSVVSSGSIYFVVYYYFNLLHSSV